MTILCSTMTALLVLTVLMKLNLTMAMAQAPALLWTWQRHLALKPVQENPFPIALVTKAAKLAGSLRIPLPTPIVFLAL